MEANQLATLKVAGVGGAGVNSVNRMIETGLKGIEFIAVNTDAQVLLQNEADIKLDIGREETRGLGAGADPAVGERSALENEDKIREALAGADMVFVAAGEGGGTGTGAAPIVAKAAREQGALTIGIVTRPFSFEGTRRARAAEQGIAKLQEQVDALIVIPNDRLLELSDPDISMVDSFQLADGVLVSGVQGITDLITTTGLQNVDFADVKSVLKGSGAAVLGIGSASGEARAERAVEIAISSPLLETSIEGACGALVYFQGGSDMGIQEVAAAANMIRDIVSEDCNLIYGSNIDDSLGDEIRVTVIAAGFEDKDAAGAEPAGQQAAESEALRRSRQAIGLKAADKKDRMPSANQASTSQSATPARQSPLTASLPTLQRTRASFEQQAPSGADQSGVSSPTSSAAPTASTAAAASSPVPSTVTSASRVGDLPRAARPAQHRQPVVGPGRDALGRSGAGSSAAPGGTATHSYQQNFGSQAATQEPQTQNLQLPAVFDEDDNGDDLDILPDFLR